MAGVPETAGLECWQVWAMISQEAEAKAQAAARKKAEQARKHRR